MQNNDHASQGCVHTSYTNVQTIQFGVRLRCEECIRTSHCRPLQHGMKGARVNICGRRQIALTNHSVKEASAVCRHRYAPIEHRSHGRRHSKFPGSHERSWFTSFTGIPDPEQIASNCHLSVDRKSNATLHEKKKESRTRKQLQTTNVKIMHQLAESCPRTPVMPAAPAQRSERTDCSQVRAGLRRQKMTTQARPCNSTLNNRQPSQSPV
jgi:hypothetical protein